MSDGIYVALSGAVAQQRSLDVVANNVANANTTGFQADRVAFSQELARAAEDGPGPDALRFVSVNEVATDFSPGAHLETGGALDMAIDGDGFFVVQTPGGERYTRAGNFRTNADGVLTTPDGLKVMARNDESPGAPAEIRIPPDAAEITVSQDGTIAADGNPVARLRVVRFETPPQKEGLTLYTANQPATAADDARVSQGYLESSNINAVAGMNELITVTRSFEAFQKVIDAYQQLDQRTARDLGSRSR